MGRDAIRSEGGAGAGTARRVALAVVVAGGAALRLVHLDQPVRYDEAVTFLEYVARPLGRALALYDLPNNHLFHTFLAHLSVSAFGDGPVALRLPAFAAGVMVPPAVYLAGRAVHGRDVGLVAAALAAASPVLVLFSANARGYSLVVLAFLALVPPAAMLRRRSSPLAWLVVATVAALGAWAMPTMLYPAGAVAAWLLLAATRPGGRGVRRVAAEGVLAAAAAAALTALLYLPVLQRSGLDAVVANRFVGPHPVAEFAARVPGFLADVALQWAHGVPAPVTILLAAGAGAEAVARARAVLAGDRSGDGAAAALLPVGLAWSLFLLAATRRVPVARVWLFLLPTFLLFASAGLARLWGRARRLAGDAATWLRPALAAPVAALALGGWTAVHLLRTDAVRRWPVTGTFPHGDRVAAFLAERWEPGDVVQASIPSDAPLEYYFRRAGLPTAAVNALPAPGGCIYIVVNRRHGQSLGAADARGAAPDPEPVLLREWPGVAVHVDPSAAGASGGSGRRSQCEP